MEKLKNVYDASLALLDLQRPDHPTLVSPSKPQQEYPKNLSQFFLKPQQQRQNQEQKKQPRQKKEKQKPQRQQQQQQQPFYSPTLAQPFILHQQQSYTKYSQREEPYMMVVPSQQQSEYEDQQRPKQGQDCLQEQQKQGQIQQHRYFKYSPKKSNDYSLSYDTAYIEQNSSQQLQQPQCYTPPYQYLYQEYHHDISNKVQVDRDRELECNNESSLSPKSAAAVEATAPVTAPGPTGSAGSPGPEQASLSLSPPPSPFPSPTQDTKGRVKEVNSTPRVKRKYRSKTKYTYVSAQVRKERNRLNSKEFRERKKQELEELKRHVFFLEQLNASLKLERDRWRSRSEEYLGKLNVLSYSIHRGGGSDVDADRDGHGESSN